MPPAILSSDLLSQLLPLSFAGMGKSRDPEIIKLDLRVRRTTFRKKTGELKRLIKKRRPECKKAKNAVRKLEAELHELGEELSEEVPSCDTLLGDTSSDSPATPARAKPRPR